MAIILGTPLNVGVHPKPPPHEGTKEYRQQTEKIGDHGIRASIPACMKCSAAPFGVWSVN
jgi:hypothetical protein